MPDKVVDASALGAWLFVEPRAEESMALLKDAALYAPVLLTFELANTARKKAILYPEQKDALIEALRFRLILVF